MYKIYLAILCLLTASFTFAQSNSKNVIQSDISNVYRNAVKESFYTTLNSSYCLSQGYQGQIDLGSTFGIGNYAFTKFEVNSTHGYQFNPYYYLGGGVGAHFMLDYNDNFYRHQVPNILLYLDSRLTFIESNITPYIESRIGYFVTNFGGMYVNFSLGCRFAVYYRQAINLSVGYSFEKLGFEYYTTREKFNTNNFSVKLGYEF